MSVVTHNKSHFEGYSYRELQKIAKGLKIPANLKKQYLVQLLRAHQNKETYLMKSIVATAMSERDGVTKEKTIKHLAPTKTNTTTRLSRFKLAPKQPIVVLKNSSLLLSKSTNLGKTLQVRLDRNLESGGTSSNNNSRGKRTRNMSCARTNTIQENSSSSAAVDHVADSTSTSITRKNATMLETLLQAPMSSKLEDIAADCMRGDESQRVRTVKVVGDAEIKKPSSDSGFICNMDSESLMEDMTPDVITDLRVVGSEVKQLQWDSEQTEDNQNMDNSMDDPYLQTNLGQCYNYRDFSTSSEHDHQYRGLADPFGMVDKKSILVNSNQDSSLVDNLMSSLSSQNQSLDSAIESVIDIHETPIKSQICDRNDYDVNFDSTEITADKCSFVEVGDYHQEGAEQSNQSHGNDFYNDHVVHDSCYSLDRTDQMSPRTYSSIFNEYLLSEMGVNEVNYSNYSSSPQETGNIMESQNSYLECSVQAMEQDENMNLHQELLPGQSIPESMGQHDYPVLSLGSGVIGESEFDPISSALTQNFPNYGSLGLSPPREEEEATRGDNLVRSKESCRQSKNSSRWDKTLQHYQLAAKPTAMLCFLCNWIGKFSSIESHLHKSHYRQIIQSIRGIVTLEVNLQSLASGMHPTKELAMFQHRDRLYLIKFKLTEPNIFNVSVLAVSPQGSTAIIETPMVCFIQVMDPSNGEEVNWKGCVENLCLQPSSSNNEESAFKNSSKKGVDMHLKDFDPRIFEVNSKVKRKVLVDVMIQTYHDVLDIENSKNKDETFS